MSISQRPSSTATARGPRRGTKLAITLGAAAAASAIMLPAVVPLTTTGSTKANQAAVNDAASARLAKAVAKASRSTLRRKSAKERAAAKKAAKLAAAKRQAKRRAARRQAARAAARDVIGTRYAITALNVRTAADSDARVVDVLDAGDKVKITDEKDGVWRQVIVNGEPSWVKAEFLSATQPDSDAGSGGAISFAACSAAAGGSGVEGGIGTNATKVHRAVCARFPQIKVYGGYRAGSGNHSQGKALDIMVTDSALRAQIADFIRANAASLGVTEVIRSQHIWTTQRASEGWRAMADRGSVTANHYDHVHVSVR